MLFNHQLISHSLIISRGLKFGIHALHPYDQLMALLLQTFARSKLARVQPLAVRAVDRFGGWRSAKETKWAAVSNDRASDPLQASGQILQTNIYN